MNDLNELIYRSSMLAYEQGIKEERDRIKKLLPDYFFDFYAGEKHAKGLEKYIDRTAVKQK